MAQKPQQQLQVGIQMNPVPVVKTSTVIEQPKRTAGVVTKASWRIQQLAQPRYVTPKYKAVNPTIVKKTKAKGKKVEYVDIVVRQDDVTKEKLKTLNRKPV